MDTQSRMVLGRILAQKLLKLDSDRQSDRLLIKLVTTRNVRQQFVFIVLNERNVYYKSYKRRDAPPPPPPRPFRRVRLLTGLKLHFETLKPFDKYVRDTIPSLVAAIVEIKRMYRKWMGDPHPSRATRDAIAVERDEDGDDTIIIIDDVIRPTITPRRKPVKTPIPISRRTRTSISKAALFRNLMKVQARRMKR